MATPVEATGNKVRLPVLRDALCRWKRLITESRLHVTDQSSRAPATADSDIRVVHAVQVGDQPRPRWLPVQHSLRDRAGGRHIMPGEAGNPAEVRLRLLGLDANHEAAGTASGFRQG